ncbi:MAG: peroxiredoxin [Euryarchaeota archaeon]|nr:peroxiredoxin [Euryarchaeota archaeon]
MHHEYMRIRDLAPDMRLKDQEGNKRSLKDLRGKNVLLCFYPETRSDESEQEAHEFATHMAEFKARDTEVMAVTPESKRHNRRFAKEAGVGYPILSDKRHKLAEALGTWDKENGRNERATILVDADGRIDRVWEEPDPEGHAREALAHVSKVNRQEHWEGSSIMGEVVQEQDWGTIEEALER